MVNYGKGFFTNKRKGWFDLGSNHSIHNSSLAPIPSNTVSGSRPVQINLNLDNGETLISTVVNTAISAGAHAESAGNKMIDAASSVRELALSFAE